MKKVILTFTTSFLLVVITSHAKSNINAIPGFTHSVFAKVELNSFCKAIMQGDIDTVKRMIELGEDVNQKSLGMTPAIFAARYNKAEILKLLITHGADLSIKSDKGYSVKKYAKLSNATEAMAVLEVALGS